VVNIKKVILAFALGRSFQSTNSVSKAVKQKMTKSQRQKYVSKIKFAVKANVIMHNDFTLRTNTDLRTLALVCYLLHVSAIFGHRQVDFTTYMET
jgi:hypothetical protein